MFAKVRIWMDMVGGGGAGWRQEGKRWGEKMNEISFGVPSPGIPWNTGSSSFPELTSACNVPYSGLPRGPW